MSPEDVGGWTARDVVEHFCGRRFGYISPSVSGALNMTIDAGYLTEEAKSLLLPFVETTEHPDHLDTIEHLANLLEGVMADDPQAIRDAAAWLAANRPEEPTP